MKRVSILVVSIADPLLVGIYENEKLIDTIEISGKTSDVLPVVFKKLNSEYTFDNVIYVNGPGSHMSIKVTYLFLSTFAIVKGIKLLGIDGFELNQNSPIKALGKKYFFKDNDGKIHTKLLESDEKLNSFKLPQSLQGLNFLSDPLPSYNLPAVY
ncbi:MAG: hypothetical protein IE909_04105 [Campylobacterales bacterium]|nr:hypothetical protein [Campylobacterales bacterium]